MKPTQRARLAA